MQTQITNSYEKTQKAGFEFADKLKNGRTVALYGNLGSGKTTFVQGLAKGLGINKKIISPTFIIVRTYEIPKYSSSEAKRSREALAISSRQTRIIRNFYHIDLYRIENEKDLKGLGLEEILNDKSNIVVIEWPEKIKKYLPKETISINFEYLSNEMHQITFN